MDDEQDDDIQLAIQLSLLEVNGGKSVSDEDEDLAIAVEESLRSSLQQSSSSNSSRRSHKSYQIVCDVCDKATDPRTEVIIKHEFWNQYLCRHHILDGTPNCFSCTRLKGKDAEYIRFGDGRNICGDCFGTVVKNGREKQSVLDNVREFLRLKDVEFKGNIPVLLVDGREMRKHTRHGPLPPNAPVFGLTISNPIESYVEHVESLSRRGGDIMVQQKEFPFNRSNLVTILVLFGLPKVMTGAVMAHELMHAWFRQTGVFNLEMKVEEGICQVMAYEWLEWLEASDEAASSCSRSEEAHFERNLKQICKGLVEHDSSHAYGEGFREAKWAIERWGFHKVINHVINHGTLPD